MEIPVPEQLYFSPIAEGASFAVVNAEDRGPLNEIYKCDLGEWHFASWITLVKVTLCLSVWKSDTF